MDNKSIEKKQKKIEYMRKYYKENSDKWKNGNKYHSSNYQKSDLKGFKLTKGKILISFD